MRMAIRTMGILALCLGAASSAHSQFPPDSLVNLKYFSEVIPVRELIGHMRGFSVALGVRCQYCHVGEEGQPLSSFDFSSDEKRTKRTARVMLEMVDAINERHLTDIPERKTPNVAVECATCHRGLSRPRMLVDELSVTLDAEGLDAAIARYRELRDRYYGSGSYDFGEFVLSGWAESLARATQFTDALGILELNSEMYPESGGVHLMWGEVFRLSGDTTAAISRYQKAIELNPEFKPTIDRALARMRSP